MSLADYLAERRQGAMSDFLAVAGVSLVLRWTLQEALAGSGLDTVLGATPAITTLPPDRMVIGENEVPQLNLFMYHADLNQGWRNATLPERNGDRRAAGYAHAGARPALHVVRLRAA